MEQKICLDTDVLVDVLRNKPHAVEFITSHESASIMSTTIINLFELFFGAYKSGSEREIFSVETLSQRLPILPINEVIVREAGFEGARLAKNGSMIDFRDLLIGIITRSHGFQLKTNNISDFSRIPGLTIFSD